MITFEEAIQPERAAVLIIDMQNDYVHRDGAVLRYFRSSKDGRDIGAADGPSFAEPMVSRLIDFIGAARQAQVPLIWVRTINDEFTVSPVAKAQGKKFVQPDDPWGTAFYDGLEREPDEQMVTKHRHSAFFGTELDTMLEQMGIQTVLLTGVSTPYCVESTARDAFARDHRVVTVADCTASKVLAEHEDSLSRLGRVFGQVATSEQIMSVWNRHYERG